MPLSINYPEAWARHKDAKVKTGCKFGHRTNVECDENTVCSACGWNPAVEQARYDEIVAKLKKGG